MKFNCYLLLQAALYFFFSASTLALLMFSRDLKPFHSTESEASSHAHELPCADAPQINNPTRPDQYRQPVGWKFFSPTTARFFKQHRSGNHLQPDADKL